MDGGDSVCADLSYYYDLLYRYIYYYVFLYVLSMVTGELEILARRTLDFSLEGRLINESIVLKVV